MNIKKDDKVVVLSGKDKGKEGKVLSADPKGGKLIVEGVNVATRSPTARRSASARSAAPNCKGGSNELWQICLL